MAGEFEKRIVDGQNVWTCNTCGQEIVNQSKPRNHLCMNMNPEDANGLNTGATSSTPFVQPPVNPFSTPQSTGTGVAEGRDIDALFRFQQLQAEQNKQMMQFMQQQNQSQMNQMMEMLKLQKTETKVKCPRWEKDENVKNFINRLKKWDIVEKGKGKYLQMLEALQLSERKNEKRRIELEEQNGFLKPEEADIIERVIEKLEKWFGKTKIDEASDSWEKFIEMKRSDTEKIDEFLLRFETSESQLRNSAVELPNMVLSLQLLKSVNVTSDQRRNILAQIKFENSDTIYDDLKSSMRLMKGSLVEGRANDDKNKEEEINYNNSSNFRRFRSRSKSKGRFESRSFDGHGSDRGRANNRGREHSRGREYSRGRESSRERGMSKNRKYSQDRNSFRRSRSRDYNYDGNRGKENKDRSYESVNLVFKETGCEAEMETNENLDKMIIDSGTTKTVAGKEWIENYLESISPKDRELVKNQSEERFFRFGNSVRYPSTQEIAIPIKLGKLESTLYVSVVNACIPLLLGKPDLKRFGFVIDFEKETVFLTRTHEVFPLETTVKGHLALPLVGENILEDEVFLMDNCDKKEKERKVLKIHKVLAHPLPNILKQFFRNSSENDKEVMAAVDSVTENCSVCKRFSKSPSRPKVALPISSDFNDCVALDLKVRKQNKGYILYCICTFSRLTRAVLIQDKNPHTIVSGILDCWVLGKGIGPGIPGKFMFDNGGEFNNPEVIDLAEKHGIKMHGVTAAHSPFSNGLCERNHEVVDRMMSKLMADDSKLKANDALHQALFAKNIEPNNKGFSSFQIVYGNNPTIPGITNSTPPSLSTEFASKDVRDHLAQINKAREAFRVADNDEKIKRALKSRIASYNNERFESGDKVYFKQKDKMEWSGPASVIGQQGKVVFLKYGNNLRRVHMSRIIRVGEEFQTKTTIAEETKEADIPTTDKTESTETEVADNDEEEKQEQIPRLKRKAATRRPEKSRRIIFKNSMDKDWTYALVKSVGPNSGSNQFKCTLSLENGDELIIDFSENHTVWEYEKFKCERCGKTFDTRRSLKLHISLVHKEKKPAKVVTFKETEEVNFNDQHETKKLANKAKIRFKEIIEEET